MALPQVRYIKNSLEGNTYNDYCHWIEIQAISGGSNVALGKTVTPSKPGRAPYDNPAIVTDGKLITGSVPDYFDLDLGTAYIVVDLGQAYDLDSITLWHYYPSPTDRRYHGNVVEISSDGENWLTIFDSNVDGEYIETIDGLVLTEIPLKTEEEVLEKIGDIKLSVATFDGKIDSMLADITAMKTQMVNLRTDGLTALSSMEAADTSYKEYQAVRDVEIDEVKKNSDDTETSFEELKQNSDFTLISDELQKSVVNQTEIKDLVEEFKTKLENM